MSTRSTRRLLTAGLVGLSSVALIACTGNTP
jgi:ribose transport system substrate-binding protein